MSQKFSFSGHETFPLRLSWLKKAVDAVQQNPNVFREDDAIATFGVGKNMVRSIRHWSLTTGIIKQIEDKEQLGSFEVTSLGHYLFADNGADPYCEDPATLWLIHWLICNAKDRASLWYYVFGHWQDGALDTRVLEPNLEQWLKKNGTVKPSTATIKRDLLCLINTYIPPHTLGKSLEDVVARPLSSLGLLFEVGSSVYLRERKKSGVPPEIFAYAVIEFWKQTSPDTKTLSIDNILTNRGSPGRILLLSEEEMFELIQQIELFDLSPFRFDSTAGLRQLYRMSDTPSITMLDHYFSAVAL